MIGFLQCLAEGFAEQGLKGLAHMVPGGNYVLQVAQSALEKYRVRRDMDAVRAEIEALARQNYPEAKQAAEQAVGRVAAAAPIEDRIRLELLLTSVPSAVRQAMKRPDDPTGTTVPVTFKLDNEDDLVKLLPARPPRFRAGLDLPRRPGWVLDRQLGLGGFGEVWLASNREAEHLKLAVKFGRDADADRDLLNEKDVIRRLMAAAPHPSLVPLKDVSFDGDTPWLAYEYVDGGDLADLIRRWQGRPKEERARRAVDSFRELVEAVAALHERGIVHRDLKPSNVLVEAATSRLRVTDFGISGIAARVELRGEAAGTTTRAGRLLSCVRGAYTPLYASPQQKDNQNADRRDDVHALGVIAYQMYTGRFDRAPGVDIMNDMTAAGASKELVRVVAGCVSGEPGRRPKDATALLAKLSDAAPSVELVKVATRLPVLPPVAPPAPKVTPLKAKRVRRRPISRDDDRYNDRPEPQGSGSGCVVAVVVVLIVVALAAVGGYFLFEYGQSRPEPSGRSTRLVR